MSANAEILCSRCGTPFPKEKDKAAVTCLVCGQLRPDLDMTLDDDDDLAAALGSSAGGGADSGSGIVGSGSGSSGSSSRAAAPEVEAPSHVLRVASAASSTIDSPPVPRSSRNFRVDQPYMAMSETRTAAASGNEGVAAESGDRLMERIGGVVLIVCPLAAGMAGALNMLSRTEDFSTGTWYAVGAVFVIMLAAALFLGLAVSGLLFLLRVRWAMVIRVVFVAAAAVACVYGLRLIPSHVQVRQNDLPGFVLRP